MAGSDGGVMGAWRRCDGLHGAGSRPGLWWRPGLGTVRYGGVRLPFAACGVSPTGATNGGTGRSWGRLHAGMRWVLCAVVTGARPSRLGRGRCVPVGSDAWELDGRRGLGSGPVWLLLRPWVAPRQLGRLAAAAGMFRRWLVHRWLVSAFDSSLRRSGITFVEGPGLSQLRSISRLAPGAAGPRSSRVRPQDRAHLAPGAAGRVDGG